jgi:hypothetical protein
MFSSWQDTHVGRDLYKQIIGGLGTHVVEGVEFVDPTNDLIKLQQTIGRGVRDPNRPLIVFLPTTHATSDDIQQAVGCITRR